MPALLKRPRFLLVLAVLASLIAGAIQLVMATSSGASTSAIVAGPTLAEPIDQLSLVTVRQGLPPGHIIRSTDLSEIGWPQGQPPIGAIVAGSEDALSLPGAVTRRAVAAGELFHQAAVIRPGERGFLSALVAPGNRAIAIAVDATSSAGGLIWPGDRVDVILTQEIREDGVPFFQRVLSETIMMDVRILSIDQRLETAAQSDNGPDDSRSTAGGGDSGRSIVPATVTLEVTPEQAETVTVGAMLGRLNLTLRGVEKADEDGAEADLPATWAGTVSPALATVRLPADQGLSAPVSAPVASAQKPSSGPVRIYRGSSEVAQ